MIVFIDRQHAGKPNKLADRGAAVDINGDATPEREAIITGQISLELEKILMLMGVEVMPISDGTYNERHARVNEYAALYPNRKTVYLAMHLNAGGGAYGAFFYHHASAQGKQLAQRLCDAMQIGGIVEIAKAIECKPSNWTKNAFYTIRGVGRPVAICCEPLFMDNDQHAKHLTYEGIQGLAMCMANAIVKWGNND
jgi:N-acetylmuramoyl-L-alanine amidase